MIKEIEIRSEAQVQKINQLACETPYEVWLSSGSIMLDARSLLGLFALVGKKAHVVVEDYVTPRSFQNGAVTYRNILTWPVYPQPVSVSS